MNYLFGISHWNMKDYLQMAQFRSIIILKDMDSHSINYCFPVGDDK